MNLKEAKKAGKLDEFIKEHEVVDPEPDAWDRFWKLVELMTGSSASEEISDEEHGEGSDETQTRPNT
jgi:hypothetical protein